MQLSRAAYIPKHAAKVTPKNIDAVIYTYGMADRPYALGFAGKAQKPTFHHRFQSEAHRARFVAEWIEGLTASANYKAKRKAEKQAFVHTLQVGTILRSSWGYDQTNIDFYEVTALVSRTMVEVRKLCQESTETGYMCGQCVPLPGQYCGEPMRKRVLEGNIVDVLGRNYGRASVYEMKEIAPGVKVGPATYWSAYA